MKHQWIYIICLASIALFILTACQPAPVATQASPVETKKPAQPTEASADEQATSVTLGGDVTCRVRQSLFPPINDDDWIRGSKEAKTTILEYSDFMCPYCAMIEPVLERLIKENPDDIRLVYRHFPLISIHDKAAITTQAAEAAGLQGKFWEMHDLLLTEQQEWNSLDLEKINEWLIDKAVELGLDKAQFTKDLTSEKMVKMGQSYFDEGQKIGLPGTPTLAINGVFYGGDMSFDTLSNFIKKSGTVSVHSECPPMTIDLKKKYTATLHLEKGDITIELFADKAPVTVNSFVSLAREGWYDGSTFHRVIPNFVAQAGDPYGTGSGGPGYEFINEIAPGLTFGEVGVVGMANGGPNTNGSQFFITYEGIPEDTVKQLDGNYTIFGKVTEGMDVVKKLTPRDPAQNPGLPPGDEIKSITIEEK